MLKCCPSLLGKFLKRKIRRWGWCITNGFFIYSLKHDQEMVIYANLRVLETVCWLRFLLLLLLSGQRKYGTIIIQWGCKSTATAGTIPEASSVLAQKDSWRSWRRCLPKPTESLINFWEDLTWLKTLTCIELQRLLFFQPRHLNVLWHLQEQSQISTPPQQWWPVTGQGNWNLVVNLIPTLPRTVLISHRSLVSWYRQQQKQDHHHCWGRHRPGRWAT